MSTRIVERGYVTSRICLAGFVIGLEKVAGAAGER
jgi:hypothetical protein